MMVCSSVHDSLKVMAPLVAFVLGLAAIDTKVTLELLLWSSLQSHRMYPF
jgi:hypothetical protein